jgi:hypothetical protein
VFVLPEVLFPGIKGTEQELVQLLDALSRDDTLFYAARLNTLISGPGDFDTRGRQQQALNHLCTTRQIEAINEFIRSRGPAAGPVTVFFRGQILELMRWTARFSKNLAGEARNFADLKRRQVFLKALLIAGVLWGNRVFGGRLSKGLKVDEARLRALGAFRKSAEEGNLGPHLGVALGRGKALFVDHLPTRLPGFQERFHRTTGLTVEQYRACVASLSVYTLFNHKDGPLFTTNVGAATALRDVFPTYLDLDAQSSEQLSHSLWHDFDRRGYRALRERPIMVAADGHAIILDPTFFAEKVSIGPLFHLLKGLSPKEANEVFGAFGLAFEDYATDILRRMYPSRPLLVDRVAYGLKGKDAQNHAFEIDASLFDARAAVLFEIKAAWLREDAIADSTHETLVRDIRAKYGIDGKSSYGIDGKSSNERGKGVAQLARSIGAITRGEWTDKNHETNVFYPVLLVHDTRLDIPGLGSLLEADFRSLLGDVPAGKIVAPLTLMTIKDLETLESSIEGFSLIEFLAAYTRDCSDRIQSVHNYIVFSEFGRRVVPNRHLTESSSEILTLLTRELFPGSGLMPAPGGVV